MAKDTEKKAPAAPAPKVTVQDLASEYGIEARKIRVMIRGLGFSAPPTEDEPGTFGPKAKYEWDANSTELKKIRKAIESGEKPSQEKPKKTSKKTSKKAAEPVEPEESDEDDEEEGDED